MIDFLTAPEKHEEHLKVVLINGKMQWREIKSASLLIEVEHGILVLGLFYCSALSNHFIVI